MPIPHPLFPVSWSGCCCSQEIRRPWCSSASGRMQLFQGSSLNCPLWVLILAILWFLTLAGQYLGVFHCFYRLPLNRRSFPITSDALSRQNRQKMHVVSLLQPRICPPVKHFISLDKSDWLSPARLFSSRCTFSWSVPLSCRSCMWLIVLGIFAGVPGWSLVDQKWGFSDPAFRVSHDFDSFCAPAEIRLPMVLECFLQVRP